MTLKFPMMPFLSEFLFFGNEMRRNPCFSLLWFALLAALAVQLQLKSLITEKRYEIFEDNIIIKIVLNIHLIAQFKYVISCPCDWRFCFSIFSWLAGDWADNLFSAIIAAFSYHAVSPSSILLRFVQPLAAGPLCILKVIFPFQRKRPHSHFRLKNVPLTHGHAPHHCHQASNC